MVQSAVVIDYRPIITQFNTAVKPPPMDTSKQRTNNRLYVQTEPFEQRAKCLRSTVSGIQRCYNIMFWPIANAESSCRSYPRHNSSVSLQVTIEIGRVFSFDINIIILCYVSTVRRKLSQSCACAHLSVSLHNIRCIIILLFCIDSTVNVVRKSADTYYNR